MSKKRRNKGYSILGFALGATFLSGAMVGCIVGENSAVKVIEFNQPKQAIITTKIENNQPKQADTTAGVENNQPIKTATPKKAENIKPTTAVKEPAPKETPIDTPFKSLGMFTATAYCPCYECSGGYGNSTATGAIATEGVTIAVDKNVIPYGTKVIINGHTYIAQDCGGAIKGKKVDIYFDNHAEATNFGKQKVEVFIER